MKNRVLVASSGDTVPWISCARRPTLLPNEVPQMALCLGCLIKCRYSRISSESLSNTALAHLQKNSAGKFLEVVFFGVNFTPVPEISSIVMRTSWETNLWFDPRRDLVLAAGVSASGKASSGPGSSRLAS